MAFQLMAFQLLTFQLLTFQLAYCSIKNYVSFETFKLIIKNYAKTITICKLTIFAKLTLAIHGLLFD